MSKWCSQCHDDWHEGLNTANRDTNDPPYPFPRVWRRNPVNAMIPRASTGGCGLTCHVSALDRSNYTVSLIQAGKGLPVTTSDLYADYVYYLPWSTTGSGTFGGSGMDTPDSILSAGGSRHSVFCLSCHFAHGGPYNDALRWEHVLTVALGDFTGQPIASNKGCQLCHNK